MKEKLRLYREDNVLQRYMVAISANCKNPELATRFLDYGFTEKGHMLYNFGIEGLTYNMENGIPTFTDLIKNNPEGLSFVEASVRYTRGAYSGIFEHDPNYIKQSLTYPEQQQHAYDVWSNTNMSEHLMPPITLSNEEQGEFADIMVDVSTYVSEKMIQYVCGKHNTEDFDEYLEKLNSFGLQRAIEIKQNALDRYDSK